MPVDDVCACTYEYDHQVRLTRIILHTRTCWRSITLTDQEIITAKSEEGLGYLIASRIGVTYDELCALMEKCESDELLVS